MIPTNFGSSCYFIVKVRNISRRQRFTSYLLRDCKTVEAFVRVRPWSVTSPGRYDVVFSLKCKPFILASTKHDWFVYNILFLCYNCSLTQTSRKIVPCVQFFSISLFIPSVLFTVGGIRDACRLQENTLVCWYIFSPDLYNPVLSIDKAYDPVTPISSLNASVVRETVSGNQIMFIKKWEL